MGPVGRLRARLNAPSVRALRDAGPPVRWLVIAGVAGVAAVVILYLAGVRNAPFLIAVPLVAFIAACAADRDGWRIRMATAELAARQRERWTSGSLPVDPVSAEAWLQTHADAPPGERAAVMATANRPAEGRALLEDVTGETPEMQLRLERLRITLDASLDRGVDAATVLRRFDTVAEMTAVAPDEARYQRLSLAWSLAWTAIHRGEPWRSFFGDAIRDLAPFRAPARLQLMHVTQHYAFPIAYALAWLLVSALDLDARLL